MRAGGRGLHRFPRVCTNASALLIAFCRKSKHAWTGSRTPAVKPDRNNSTPARRSVVIVDDEKSYVELMAQMIADNLECAVHPFTRPEDALEALVALSPGVVVTDYSMPNMNGIEFIQKASEIVPKAAFIIISGHNFDAVDRDLARLKMLKMRLQKPFGWRPLTDAVLTVWPGSDVPSYRDGADPA
jgi:CheY-like chemotaxis protein